MAYFPSHLQVEVVAGLCSADCIMCTIKETPRKGLMGMDAYTTILSKFASHVRQLKFLTLHGMGEPMLDNSLPEKVRIAKDLGFAGVGFATNATHLTTDKAESLLNNGVDTIIFSLDGIQKETHEKIRRGVDYDQVLNNVLDFIALRDAKDNKTKVIIRMIRQEDNKNEWDEYQAFWQHRLNPAFGDQVSVFDVHNWGGVRESKGEEYNWRFKKLQDLSRNTKMVCSDLIDRMIIFVNGDVGLCCGDEKGVHNLGNIFLDDPIVIYNGNKFTQYRKMMKAGRLIDINYCKNCQIILSRMEKQSLDVGKFNG